ncbi:biotin transporter BioY [Rhodovibrio salinarum]|uniref:Biotin transporter n=2 Tax=Rhodovibrio salinarum TaxID=1087 RepID=A0A934V170_9PROT|nr:biotin transporter BioY [Rhodovibrio salinarum]
MPATLADAIWTTKSGSRSWLRNGALAVVGSLFVAACSQIQVPMWPVPMTMQTFAVMTVGMAMGWRLGAATLALYTLEGALGLPVFAGFSAGPGVLMGPTGGYILPGFILGAACVGYLAERGWDRKVWKSAVANTLGTLVLFVPGVAWLATFYAAADGPSIAGTGAETALGAAVVTGVVPFLLGGALKIALATAVVRAGWGVFNRLRG